MQRILIIGILAAVLAASVALTGVPAAQAHSTDAPALVAQLTSGAQVDAYLTAAQFHGYIFLERHGRVILSKGYGMAEVEHKVPHTIHMLKRSGLVIEP